MGKKEPIIMDLRHEDEKRQEAVVEAVLFTMGKSVELRQLAGSQVRSCGESSGRV